MIDLLYTFIQKTYGDNKRLLEDRDKRILEPLIIAALLNLIEVDLPIDFQYSSSVYGPLISYNTKASFKLNVFKELEVSQKAFLEDNLTLFFGKYNSQLKTESSQTLLGMKPVTLFSYSLIISPESLLANFSKLQQSIMAVMEDFVRFPLHETRLTLCYKATMNYAKEWVKPFVHSEAEWLKTTPFNEVEWLLAATLYKIGKTDSIPIGCVSIKNNGIVFYLCLSPETMDTFVENLNLQFSPEYSSSTLTDHFSNSLKIVNLPFSREKRLFHRDDYIKASYFPTMAYGLVCPFENFSYLLFKMQENVQNPKLLFNLLGGFRFLMNRLKKLVLNFYPNYVDLTSTFIDIICSIIKVPTVGARSVESKEFPAKFYIDLKTPAKEEGILEFKDRFNERFSTDPSEEICVYTPEHNDKGFFSLRFDIKLFLYKVIPIIYNFLENERTLKERCLDVFSNTIKPPQTDLTEITAPHQLQDISEAIQSINKYQIKEELCDYLQQKPGGWILPLDSLEFLIILSLFRLIKFSGEIRNAEIFQLNFFEISFCGLETEWNQLQENLKQYFGNESLKITDDYGIHNIKFNFQSIEKILPDLKQEIDKLDIFSWFDPSLYLRLFVDAIRKACPEYNSAYTDLFEHSILSVAESDEVPTQCSFQPSTTRGKVLIFLGISEAAAKQLASNICKIFEKACCYKGWNEEKKLQSFEFSFASLVGPMFPAIVERMNTLQKKYPDIYYQQAKGVNIFHLLNDLKNSSKNKVSPFQLTQNFSASTQESSASIEALINMSKPPSSMKSKDPSESKNSCRIA